MGLRAVKVFATSGSDVLATEVCQFLQTRLPKALQPEAGLLGRVSVETFSNGNMQVQIDNVRGHFAVVIHTQVPPVSNNLVELLALLDAIANSKPRDVAVIFPYMPYARSDRKNKPRISVMAPRLADILCTSYGLTKILLLDPHDNHCKHFFKPAADEISAMYLLVDYIERSIFPTYPRENCAIVFADAGAAKRFSDLAYILKLPVAHIDKDRPDDTEQPDFKKVIGEVRDRICLLVDDEILTGGTVLGDTSLILSEGAGKVLFLAIHAPLENKKTSTQEVIRKLEDSPLERIVVTNSIPVAHKLGSPTKFVVLTVAPLLAEAIARMVQDDSLTDLHQPCNVRLYRA